MQLMLTQVPDQTILECIGPYSSTIKVHWQMTKQMSLSNAEPGFIRFSYSDQGELLLSYDAHQQFPLNNIFT